MVTIVQVELYSSVMAKFHWCTSTSTFHFDSLFTARTYAQADRSADFREAVYASVCVIINAYIG